VGIAHHEFSGGQCPPYKSPTRKLSGDKAYRAPRVEARYVEKTIKPMAAKRLTGSAKAFCLVGCSAIIGVFDGFAAWRIAHQEIARGFPQADGTVVGSEVQFSDGDGESAAYIPKIEYDYVVAGRPYTGNRYRYGTIGHPSHAATERIVRRYPQGRKTKVYYNPADPADSLLRPGVDGSVLLLVLFLAPWNLMVAVGWVIFANSAASRR
jgi:hypothetical protein